MRTYRAEAGPDHAASVEEFERRMVWLRTFRHAVQIQPHAASDVFAREADKLARRPEEFTQNWKGGDMTSIYERIGGQEALIAVVDDLYDRVLADPGLAGYFAGTNLSRLKGRQVEFFTAALGGPDQYRGLSMKDVHRGRGIDQAAFDRVAELLSDSLLDAGIGEATTKEIIELIAPLSKDIVSPAV